MAEGQLNIEVDGKAIAVPHGSTVMDAANRLGIYIPHFCYHKKLSIAANCRMCLVQVEKAPKPLPACATPVTDGMKVQTHSKLAVDAQKSVMEFLLINHPLDCPICDQGGECQLQDLAVGYGGSSSRYQEEKRVVFHKKLGPLVSAEEMTRCIQCTRCVRFGQEIAGVMELGMVGRGEHTEIVTFVGKTVDSELSGNMIDICPVGALTSMPFRYTARTWELARRKSISPHDSLGSNLIVQIHGDRVKRVLPLENEAVNECWISDKDRFSYTALNTTERLEAPMIRVAGEWKCVDWQVALETVVRGLRDVLGRHGGDALGALVSAHATLEELALAGDLVRGLGSDNIDYRLREVDFSADGATGGAPWLGMPIVDVGKQDRVLVIGSFLRKDHPLIAQRLRQAAKRGTKVMSLHAVDDDWLMPIAAKAVVPPSSMPVALAEIVVAAAHLAGKPVPVPLVGLDPGEAAKSIAALLVAGEKRAIFLGNAARQHPQAARLHALAQALAQSTGATLGFLGEAANAVGAELARARPQEGGRDAVRLASEPRRAYLLLHAEPEFDCANPVGMRVALDRADFVVVMSPFRHGEGYADAMLPVAPFSETSGTFVSCEGRVQSFRGAVRPFAEARPAWKVLRVLGTMLGLPGFELESSEQVRDRIVAPGRGIADRLSNAIRLAPEMPARVSGGLERIADVPIYFADPLVRRAPPLQQTTDARPPKARMHRTTLQRIGVAEGAQVRITQGQGSAVLAAATDERVPPGVVRIAAAHPSTCGLEGLTGPIDAEPA